MDVKEFCKITLFPAEKIPGRHPSRQRRQKRLRRVRSEQDLQKDMILTSVREARMFRAVRSKGFVLQEQFLNSLKFLYLMTQPLQLIQQQRQR